MGNEVLKDILMISCAFEIAVMIAIFIAHFIDLD